MGGRFGGTVAASLNRINLALIALVLAYAAVQAFTGEGLDLPDGATTSRQVGDLLMFAFLCALASFAVVEALKRLFNVRGWYQLERTRLWFTERTRDEDRAFRQLIDAIGVTERRRSVRQLFNLPTEQLVAQIGAAADVALSSPRSSDAFLSGLSGRDYEDGELERMQDDDLRQLAQRVRAGVDHLQITLGAEWRRSVQGAVMWIAGLFGIGLAFVGDIGSASHARYVLVALILGGVLAWTVRDLTRVVENARR